MEGLKGKKILITGGAGFIGSNLANFLFEKGQEVLAIDIKVHPKSLFSINKLQKKTKFRKIDIRNKDKIVSFIKNYKPHFILHLAAQSLVVDGFTDPLATFSTNIMGTVNLLEAARRSPSLEGIIVASSDKAYGKTRKTCREDFPLKGDHPYDVSKSSADLIAQAYFKTYNLPVAITRFGNVYGQGDFHFERIIPGICQAIIEKKKLKIRSNGKFVRDYIHIKDVVGGYLLLLANMKKIGGQAYNFSSKDNLSVITLIKKIEKKLNLKLRYKVLNTAKNEIPYQHLNDLKIRRLGWKPVFDIENSIVDVLDWYRDIL